MRRVFSVASTGELASLAEAAAGVRIGTHDGSFHCDEALACALLRMLPEYAHAPIIRSRDEGVLAECAIVVDVGGVFDVNRRRFDHHQRSASICVMV
jgi:uncharacterized UPF0160 family protein